MFVCFVVIASLPQFVAPDFGDFTYLLSGMVAQKGGLKNAKSTANNNGL